MKKLVALSLSAGMMLAAAMPALAISAPMPTPIVMNTAIVGGNTVYSSANTGYNSQFAEVGTQGSSGILDGTTSVVGGGVNQQIFTGPALSRASSVIGVNQGDCGCFSFHTHNDAVITENPVTSSANSGYNSQMAGVSTTGVSGGFFDGDIFVGGRTSVVGGGVFQGMQTGGAASEGWSLVSVNQ